ncbi:DNA alkylation repair protein [Streptomyces sp. PKU-MA01144]|uniref:DNA alkylation repair protein n=1 Tax=Streptomyces TaxID=1883 RepID=UPI00147E73E8|nr:MULTISPECIES: DNA alkylation repair protein [Streptomyces]MCY0984176.1 DNA alkylation repair protein [Streptomyces tirandamycinicus]NNJ06166.1 DNA alkylation repair protein [Streptomyces sp. PKU-MA01144]
MPTADELIDARTTDELASVLAAAGGGPASAVRDCGAALAGLAFSLRVTAVKEAVLADLPDGYPAFAAVIRAALDQSRFTGWMTFPVDAAVAERALADGVFEPALDLLAELTPRHTAEMAVRPFLAADLPRALRPVLGWTGHPDPHVRRLASEGTRPRLPWAPRLAALVADPGPALPVLDALYRDPSEYVRRSVANHLNDISRDHPDTAVAVAARWLADPAPTTPSLVRHGLRTLVKAGRPDALALLGFDPEARVQAAGPDVRTPEVHLGEPLVFGYEVTNTGPRAVRVVVDYVVHHRKANGALTPKVFKLTTRELAPGGRWSGIRRHPLRMLSTRRYHPGVHRVHLQINGRPYGAADFVLRGPREQSA